MVVKVSVKLAACAGLHVWGAGVLHSCGMCRTAKVLLTCEHTTSHIIQLLIPFLPSPLRTQLNRPVGGTRGWIDGRCSAYSQCTHSPASRQAPRVRATIAKASHVSLRGSCMACSPLSSMHLTIHVSIPHLDLNKSQVSPTHHPLTPTHPLTHSLIHSHVYSLICSHRPTGTSRCGRAIRSSLCSQRRTTRWRLPWTSKKASSPHPGRQSSLPASRLLRLVIVCAHCAKARV